MDTAPFDPDESSWLSDWPTYRVVFLSERKPGDQDPEETAEEYWRVTNASDVQEVIGWATVYAADRSYIVYVESTCLDDIPGLIRTDAITTDAYGGHSTQRSIRRIPILPPDLLRTLPFGTGVIMLRTTRPIITRLRPWTSRPDAKTLRADRNVIEHNLQAGT